MKALDTTMDSEAKTKRKSTKKAYVYTLDAAIAVLIMLLGLTLLYYRFMANPIETYYVEFLSEDAVGVLSYTKIADLCIDPGRQAGCSCPHYKKLEDLACSSDFSENPEATILDTFAEHIAKGSASGEEIADVIHEIFVENNVIDEKRFGLAILCTDLHTGQPLELYNTETYGGVQQ